MKKIRNTFPTVNGTMTSLYGAFIMYLTAIFLVVGVATPFAYANDSLDTVITFNDNSATGTDNSNDRLHGFVRISDQGILGGVCAGIAYYFGIDPLIPRAGFVIALLAFGTGILAYAILWLIMSDVPTPSNFHARVG